LSLPLLRLVLEDEELRVVEWDRLMLMSLILDEMLARRSDPASLTLDMDVSRRESLGKSVEIVNEWRFARHPTSLWFIIPDDPCI
jgi:hypothetical protein